MKEEKYEAPRVEVIELEMEDSVLTVSGNAPGLEPGNAW